LTLEASRHKKRESDLKNQKKQAEKRAELLLKNAS
jgi:hypothetical protein